MFEIGLSLREARTRQGLDFDEMEDRTKVRAKYLRFLEEERCEQLPGHTYTKGFLRVYADALGLDGHLYVDEYNSRYVGGEDEFTVGRVARTRPADSRRARRRSGESRTVVVALAGILLITSLVIAAWRFGGDDVPRFQGVNADGVAPAATGQSAPQPIKLVVKAVRGPSFMEVRASDGKRTPLYTGTLERGQIQRFTRMALELYVAKPRNVIVNGKRRALDPGGRLTEGGATTVK
jgi:hypothetical protein